MPRPLVERQSKRASLIEVVSGTLLGLVIAATANYYILPLFGHRVSVVDSFHIGAIFVIISVIRGYLFRRAFEYLLVHGIIR